MVRTYRKRRLRGVRRRYGGRRRLQSSSTVSYNAGSYAGLGPPRPYRGGSNVYYPNVARARSNMMAQRARAQALNRVRRKRSTRSIPKGMQMTRSKYQLGRNVTTRSLLSKLDSKNLNQQYHYTWGIRRCTAPAGFYELGCQQLPGAAGSDMQPLHVWDLNRNDGSSFLQVGSTGYRMIVDSLGQVDWYPLTRGVATNSGTPVGLGAILNGAGSLYTDTLAPLPNGELPYLVDRTVTNQTSFANARYNPSAIHEWSSIRFCFRLPTQRAGWIKVWIAKFVDELYAPGPNVTGATDQVTQFYQRMVKPSKFNPIQGVGSDTQPTRKMVVIKSWYKRFQPSETTEGDTNANHHIMKVFLRHNKYLNYIQPQNINSNDGNTTAAELDTGVLLQSLNPQPRSIPGNFKDRLFMFVQGSYYDTSLGNTTGNLPGTAFDPAIGISYDMVIRNKFVQRAI